MPRLIREQLRPLYGSAQLSSAHPGLLLARGFREYNGQGDSGKAAHIAQVCKCRATQFYVDAYQRWIDVTLDPERFSSVILQLDTRLFIGLAGSGLLETGCAIHHTYGVPYIPGSSIKGAVRSFVQQRGMDAAVIEELFGAEFGANRDDGGLSGLASFHDAWWLPGSAPRPLVPEVVTSHHSQYYVSEGEVPATDMDSPIPNAQVAVQGSFLFVVEAPVAWAGLLQKMLVQAAMEHGFGAKTRSGYGLFSEDTDANSQLQRKRQQRIAKAAETRELAEKARQQAREQAAFDALSAEKQHLSLVHAAWQNYQSISEVEQRNRRAQLLGTLNALHEDAKAWPNPDDRAAAADTLEAIYNVVGWHDPGVNAKKREKQRTKREAMLRELREPGR